MTPEYLRSLQAEIAARPDCMALAVLPEHGKVAGYLERDLQIAQILRNAGWGATSRAIPSCEAKKALVVLGRWRSICKAAQDDGHAQVEAAFNAVELATDARMVIDFKDAKAGPWLSKLVLAGLLSDSDVDALRAMCTVPSAVTADHVSRALRGPWGDEQ